MDTLLSQFNNDDGLGISSGAHHHSSFKMGLEVTIKELNQSNDFSTILNRTHPSFPKPFDVLHAKSKEDIKRQVVDIYNKDIKLFLISET